ncbi:MAG: DUF885 domain-containing protein [Actinobacteria bacterium]|nr:DUF885 domain-containing protein [Actinomycetota bacterium]
MFGTGVHSPEDRRFVGLADGVVDDVVAREPVLATRMGDHRFDGRLPNLTEEGVEEYLRVLRRHSSFLVSVDALSLSRQPAADLRILRGGVSRRLFELSQIKAHEWNPLVWNPADALYTLLARSSPADPSLVPALLSRLEQVPEFLDSARHTLGTMPGIHVEVAISQLQQLPGLFEDELGGLAEYPGVAEAVNDTLEAVAGHVQWLQRELPRSTRSPAIGERLYSEYIKHSLEFDGTPDDLRRLALEDLEKVSEELASMSAKYLGGSMADRDVSAKALARLAAGSSVSDDNVLDIATRALADAAEFVAQRALVTVPQVDVKIDLMTPVHRGVAVAYCDAPGPLEERDLPAIIGISPTPSDWSADRRASYYAEYNQHMIYDLIVHEGIPGHLLQQTMARRATPPTKVRAAMPSGLFVEGWAVYAEELMARSGFVVSPEERASLRIQQLKMQLRTILNTLLDIGVHYDMMSEAEARRLLVTRGFQQEGEVVGKWRRAQLTYGQLGTYYLGYKSVAALVDELKENNPGWRQRRIHDTVLSQGSVSPQHLRGLVGLGP